MKLLDSDVKFLAILVFACWAVIGMTAENKFYVHLCGGHPMCVSVPFEVKSYSLSNREVARVELVSPKMLRVTGSRGGRCDLEVHGEGTAKCLYEISTFGDDSLFEQLNCLEMDLDVFPEVHLERKSTPVVLGEMSSPVKWARLEELLKCYPMVKNRVRFVPDEAVILRLKEKVSSLGFEVVSCPPSGELNTWKINCLSVGYDRRRYVLLVQGGVDTEESRRRLTTCLESEDKWLATENDRESASRKGKAKLFDGRVRLEKQIFVRGMKWVQSKEE